MATSPTCPAPPAAAPERTGVQAPPPAGLAPDGPRVTHAVLNQPPPLLGHNAVDADPALREALAREGGAWGTERARAFGAIVASAGADEHRRRAQRNVPVLRTHDRFGHRVNESSTTRACTGCCGSASSTSWPRSRGVRPGPGAHVVRGALFYLFNQLDTGPCCPMSINYAATPTIRQDPDQAAVWEPRLTLPDYDRFTQAGMVMTEKQGGSDLRANSTVGDGWYELTGHKWFCTHPVLEIVDTDGRRGHRGEWRARWLSARRSCSSARGR